MATISDSTNSANASIDAANQALLDLQKQIAELNAKIDYLQLSPAKRKKIDELNKGASVVSVTQYENIPTETVDDSAIKDGGTF